MEIPSCQATTGSNMEISGNFVHTKNSFNAASFMPLLVNALGIAFVDTLGNVFAAAKSPVLLGIGITDFITSVAASWLLCGGGCRNAVTVSTVVWVEMCGRFLFLMPTLKHRLAVVYGIERSSIKYEVELSNLQGQRRHVNDSSAFCCRTEADFVNSMVHICLEFA